MGPKARPNRGGNLILMKPGCLLTESTEDLARCVELEECVPFLIGGIDRDSLPPSQARRGPDLEELKRIVV
jgi:hypothetical protein